MLLPEAGRFLLCRADLGHLLLKCRLSDDGLNRSPDTAAIEELRNYLRDAEQPTFHAIRGLGSRICKDRGMEKAAIKILMAHADEKTTHSYFKNGKKALRDSDFVIVEAPMTLAEMLG